MFEEEKYKEQVEVVRIIEQRYENQLSKSGRIAEEELQELNLGTKADPKILKIGKITNFEFLNGLKVLL